MKVPEKAQTNHFVSRVNVYWATIMYEEIHKCYLYASKQAYNDSLVISDLQRTQKVTDTPKSH